ncbi:FadR/GntR family transcriptional regulator [Pseudogemmobacter sp. W21_MBD1_M6]|uniref:FadR/GntR family transcriptional regulator n=1 Tax=Pseudogemmobacter sp. W21_MBD1_M6 TaxID=3240271 RepID=UPI003F9CE1E6
MTDPSAINVDPVARVRTYIAEGGFDSGVKLPPERLLIDTLGLTRAALRKAFDVLERDGVIWRHVGKGTFISDGVPPQSDDASVRLGRQLTPFRMMRARMAIEPAIAREAAINATGESLLRMTQALSRSRAASTWQAYEVEDDVFHRTVAEASDNLLLLSLFDQLNEVRRAVAWGNVERRTVHPSPDHTSFEQHDAIAAAISSRDPQRAYDEMRAHLRSVSARLFGEA